MAKAKESANLFSTAATIKVEPKKASKSDNKEKIEIKGLEDYAMVVSLQKNLEALKETLEGDVKTQMKEIFTRQNNKRPENFRGIEGEASASCELRKRSIRSPLKEEEVEELKKDNIPLGREVAIPRRFIFNPEYADNLELLQKMSDALRGVKGLPDNIILLQEEQSSYVVTDETLDKVCESGLLNKHFDKIAVMAVKPKLENELDIKDVLVQVRKMI